MSTEPRIIGDTPSGSETADQTPVAPASPDPDAANPSPPAEIGGRDGPDPTRYGDWEKNGRCIDF